MGGFSLDNLTDAELGRQLRQLIDGAPGADGIDRLNATSAGLCLIRSALAQNASKSEYRILGVTIDGTLLGDWVVTVQKMDATEPRPEDTPHVLAGTLHPAKVDQAINAFLRLTYVRVGRPNDTKANG